jgi:glycosyltransferase involved in cell wall biosynthesis
MKNIYLSICIPTMNRAFYLSKTLEKLSLVNSNLDDFEVIVSDNSDNDETKKVCELYSKSGLNIIYYKNPVKGFYNSIIALTLGNGMFLKLHNDYSVLHIDSISEIISLVKENRKSKPVISFTNSSKRFQSSSELCHDDFLFSLGYISTWSSAFSCWKSDIDQYRMDNKSVYKLNDQFPHTDLLYQIINKKNGLIFSKKLWDDQPIKSKGGYNIFRNFVEVHLEMFESIQFVKRGIKFKIFIYKMQLLFKFLARWYALTELSSKTASNYSFDKTNTYKYFRTKYSHLEWKLMILASHLYLFFWAIKKYFND